MSALSDASLVIACLRVADAESSDVVAGSVVAYCVVCRRALWISPTSRRMQERRPGSVIACSACVLVEVARAGGVVEVLSPLSAQRAETDAYLGRN